PGSEQLAGLSLGLALAQSMGGIEVNAAPKFSDYPFTLGVAFRRSALGQCRFMDKVGTGFVEWRRNAKRSHFG
ncbi:hypothetical protein RCO48_19725, partial [Peribacillus frigoritolerans]|nr:hypothetical protein [Peribacillus frigoritolerans]